MNLTQEYLKIFAFISAASLVALLLFASSGAYSRNIIDFTISTEAILLQDKVYFTYSVHNTGNTDLVSVDVTMSCCDSSYLTQSASLPIHPKNSTGQISNMVSFSIVPLKHNDVMLVTFDVTDNLGNKKILVREVWLQ